MSAGAHGVQKGALDPLQLDCVYHHGCWELNFGSLQEHRALRTSAVMETLCFTIICLYKSSTVEGTVNL